MKKLATIFFLFSFISATRSQDLILQQEFQLSSPYNEPDGRNDVVKVSPTDFVTIVKTKGNQSGKSEFVLERIGATLIPLWQFPLHAENFEDYKDIFFNGKEIVLLSVIHNEKEKKTKLEAYGFDVNNGKKLWTKELEGYDVGDWEASNPHKGKVKESFF